jgi:diguanylate cyclase (GGDEF)-like protein
MEVRGRRVWWLAMVFVMAVGCLFLSVWLETDNARFASPLIRLGDHLLLLVFALACVAAFAWDVRRGQNWLEQQNHVLEMIARGQSLRDVLVALVETVERHTPYLAAVYLYRDGPESQLYCAVHRRLPRALAEGIEDFRAVDGEVDTADDERQALKITDPATDERWREYRELVTSHGICAVWSLPMKAGNSQPLGRFVLFSRHRLRPHRDDVRRLQAYSHIASLAVERELYNEEIRQLAYHDSLTGLPNRRLFSMRANYALASAGSADRVAILILDIDNFKSINDTFGHLLGDELIRVAARRIQDVLEPEVTLARVGGDEFTLVIPRVRDREQAQSIALRILEALHDPVRVEGYDFAVTASIGIAIYPEHGLDLDTLFRNADAAMYIAKRGGRDAYQVYEPEMNANFYERLVIESQLPRALENRELHVYYQPRVRAADGQITSVEALLRWRHPELGDVSPGEFITIAEETGLIVPMGQWVLDTVCAQIKAWEAKGLPKVRVAVNVSGRQLLQGDFAERVKRTLSQHEVSPEWIELEITESALIRRVASALRDLNELRAAGILITIDDFGSGYSSLTRLARLPLDALKIDQSFVHDMVGHAEKMAITSAIIALGHTLNLQVVAEGVETSEQCDILRGQGCDEMQGYLFSHPVPPDEMARMLATQSIQVMA